VQLWTDNPALITVPSSVTVPAGATTASFLITENGDVWDPNGTNSNIIASDVVVASANLNVFPDAAHVTPSQQIFAFSLNPATVTGGNSTTATVNLTGAAPAGGAVVNVASANPQRVHVPATVTFPAGVSSVSFPITTSPTAFTWPITIV